MMAKVFSTPAVLISLICSVLYCCIHVNLCVGLQNVKLSNILSLMSRGIPVSTNLFDHVFPFLP